MKKSLSLGIKRWYTFNFWCYVTSLTWVYSYFNLGGSTHCNLRSIARPIAVQTRKPRCKWKAAIGDEGKRKCRGERAWASGEEERRGMSVWLSQLALVYSPSSRPSRPLPLHPPSYHPRPPTRRPPPPSLLTLVLPVPPSHRPHTEKERGEGGGKRVTWRGASGTQDRGRREGRVRRASGE